MLIRRASAATLLALCLVLTACSGDDPPAELPFQEDDSEVQIDDGAGDASTNDSAPTTEPAATIPVVEPVAIDEVWESMDIEPALADCYSVVLEDAGVTEITDLRDFADQSANLSATQQQAMADCVDVEVN